MKLEHRITRPADFSQCIALVPQGAGLSAEDLLSLPAFWDDVLERGAGHSNLVFDVSQPEQVLAFGLSAFINDERADAIKSQPKPFLTCSVLDEWRAGRRGFLSELEVASANGSGGVNLLVLNFGAIEAYDPDSFYELRTAVAQSFIAEHRGLNFRSLTNEVFGESEEFYLQAGFNIRPYWQAVENSEPPPKGQFVMGMTREEFAQVRGHFVLELLFNDNVRPRLGLEHAQRKLLRAALENETDEAIAQSLAISRSAVKKRWQALYEALLDLDHPPIPLAEHAEGQRGPGLRRLVVQYIRNHPEELHPYLPPPTISVSTHRASGSLQKSIPNVKRRE